MKTSGKFPPFILEEMRLSNCLKKKPEYTPKYLTDRVSFDRETLCIHLKDENGAIYEVDIEKCADSASVLNWIYQIHMKTWVTAEMIHDFLECINYACDQIFGNTVQGIFCPFGRVDWKTGKKRSA